MEAQVGERCAEMGMFEAARMLFSSISKHDKLASCLVRLGALHTLTFEAFCLGAL